MQNNRGFTVLEAVLAVGVLSVVMVQILGVQSASIAITQTSRDNMRATWALKSLASQIEYVLDSLGVEGLPKERSYPWAADNQFTVKLITEETTIEASRLLFSAMRIGNASVGEDENGQAAIATPGGGDEDEESGDVAGELKELGTMLDSQLPKDMYRTVTMEVAWPDGENTRKLEGGLLIIDSKALQLQLPDIPGMGGGTGNQAGAGQTGGANPSSGGGSQKPTGGNQPAGGAR